MNLHLPIFWFNRKSITNKCDGELCARRNGERGGGDYAAPSFLVCRRTCIIRYLSPGSLRRVDDYDAFPTRSYPLRPYSDYNRRDILDLTPVLHSERHVACLAFIRIIYMSPEFLRSTTLRREAAIIAQQHPIYAHRSHTKLWDHIRREIISQIYATR